MKREYLGEWIVNVYKSRQVLPSTGRIGYIRFLFENANAEDYARRLSIDLLEKIDDTLGIIGDAEMVRGFRRINDTAVDIVCDATERADSGEEVDFEHLLD